MQVSNSELVCADLLADQPEGREGRLMHHLITSLASKSPLSDRKVHLQYQSQRAVETGFRSFWLDLESWRRCAVKKINSKWKSFSPANIGHPRKVQQMHAELQNNIIYYAWCLSGSVGLTQSSSQGQEWFKKIRSLFFRCDRIFNKLHTLGS